MNRVGCNKVNNSMLIPHKHAADAEKARKEDMVRLKRQLNSWAYRKSHRHGDVEPLPENRSPQSDEWDNSVAICAIMKGENTTDVREWLMYHRCGSACTSKIPWYSNEEHLVGKTCFSLHGFWILFSSLHNTTTSLCTTDEFPHGAPVIPAGVACNIPDDVDMDMTRVECSLP